MRRRYLLRIRAQSSISKHVYTSHFCVAFPRGLVVYVYVHSLHHAQRALNCLYLPAYASYCISKHLYMLHFCVAFPRGLVVYVLVHFLHHAQRALNCLYLPAYGFVLYRVCASQSCKCAKRYLTAPNVRLAIHHYNKE